MAERQIHTVNLRPARAVSKRKRAGRAMRILREYVQRHAKVEDINISDAVNERIWQRGASTPPTSVEIQVVQRDDVAHVELADRDFTVESTTEETADAADLSDEEVAELNVDEVKDAVEAGDLDAERALDIEYAGKNRKSLIEWLEDRLGTDEPEETTADTASAEEEPEEADEEDGASEQTYDLPEDVLDTMRDGTISEGKEAAKALGKQEFEKLLNFEEAHQDRKGMKKFLRSNMN